MPRPRPPAAPAAARPRRVVFATGRLLTLPVAAVGLAGLVMPAPAFAEQYLSVEAAQALMFPGQALAPVALALTPAQAQAVVQAAGGPATTPPATPRAWRAAGGGWFVVDAVIGKHDRIDYAVALGADGKVRQVEILTYRELYGAEIRNPRWRAQFTGKALADPVKLGDDIQGISGATLSSRHVTEGVRRVLALHEVVLKGLPGPASASAAAPAVASASAPSPGRA